jgi:hypothetical protein
MSDPRTWDNKTGQNEWERLVEGNRVRICQENLAFRLQQVGSYALAAAQREINELKAQLALEQGHAVWRCMEREVDGVIAEMARTGERIEPGTVIMATDSRRRWVYGDDRWQKQ